MIAGIIRARRNGKAGLSGLLLFALLTLANFAAAEPLKVELVSVEVGYDQRTREPVLTFKMSEASRKLFAEMTEKNVGRKMAGAGSATRRSVRSMHSSASSVGRGVPSE